MSYNILDNPIQIDTSKINSNAEKINFCNTISDEIGEPNSIQYFKIPEDIVINVNNDWQTPYVSYLKTIIPDFKENPDDTPDTYHRHDLSIRNPNISQGLASEYHREFHPPFNKTTPSDQYELIVFFYYSLPNCKGPCGTQFLFQTKDDMIKEFIFPATSGDIIVVKDCKFLHKTPEIMQNVDRKIIRSYITTDTGNYKPLSCPNLKRYWPRYNEFYNDNQNVPSYLTQPKFENYGGFYRSKFRRGRNRKSKKTRKSRKNRRKSKRRSRR